MSTFFRKFRKLENRGRREDRPRSYNAKNEDLMDPILYQGGLDKEKYPVLPLGQDRKPVEEPENPLNKR